MRIETLETRFDCSHGIDCPHGLDSLHALIVRMQFAKMTAGDCGKDGGGTALENAPRFPLSHNLVLG
jgi:hypothetical protein